MAQILKQSTAVDVLIGPFVDATDAATAETGESPSVKLSKNGQALGAKNDATTPVHDADGYYNCELDATDTDTVGTLVLTVAATAAALPVRHEFQVVEEAVYDLLYASGAAPEDAAAVADAVWDESQAAHTTAGTFGITASEIAQIITDIAALNDISTADVNAQVLDVLNTDTFAEPTGVPPATATLATKIGFLYLMHRNKITVSATKKTYFGDDDVAEFEKDLSDDDTTYTETEVNAV